MESKIYETFSLYFHKIKEAFLSIEHTPGQWAKSAVYIIKIDDLDFIFYFSSIPEVF